VTFVTCVERDAVYVESVNLSKNFYELFMNIPPQEGYGQYFWAGLWRHTATKSDNYVPPCDL